MIAEKLQEVEEKIAAAKARRAPELTDDVTLVSARTACRRRRASTKSSALMPRRGT